MLGKPGGKIDLITRLVLWFFIMSGLTFWMETLKKWLDI